MTPTLMQMTQAIRGLVCMSHRWAFSFAVITALTGALGLGASPASAVPGLQFAVSSSVKNSVSQKSAAAYCPPNTRVMGGGGAVSESGTATRKLTLTQLEPFSRYDPVEPFSESGYQVSAAETAPGTTGNWLVEAYAICAPGTGPLIVSAKTVASSAAVQAKAAVCPAGQRVIGTGAKTSDVSGNVALQVARPSASGDLARAQAHEDADGYAGSWSVTAYAVCAPPPLGYQVVFAPSLGQQSESVKFALAACPAGKQLHSSGAALSNVAPGHVSLQSIFPNLAQAHTQAVAVENTATSVNWDFIIATAICAY